VEHLGCFQGVAIVNRAIINVGAQVALSCAGKHSFGYMLRNGIVGMVWLFYYKFLEETPYCFS
jgi:hypothetical protein